MATAPARATTIARQLLDRWWLLVGAVFIFSAVILYGQQSGQGIWSFPLIGATTEIGRTFGGEIGATINGTGYDGQFFYAIARQPFAIGQLDQILDVPTWRYQRIVYPLITWVVSFGRAGLVPYALVAVNIIALLFIIAYSRSWAYVDRRWLALGLVLLPGVLFALLYDLAEITAALGVIVAAVYWQRQKVWPAVACLTIAVLAREQAILFAGALFVWHWWQQRSFRAAWPWVMPAVAFVCWSMVVQWLFPMSQHLAMTAYNLGSLLSGWGWKLSLMLDYYSPVLAWIDSLFLLGLALGVVGAVRQLRSPEGWLALGMLLTVGLVATFQQPMITFPKEYTRHALLFFVAAYLLWLRRPDRWLGWSLVSQVLVSALLIPYYVWVW